MPADAEEGESSPPETAASESSPSETPASETADLATVEAALSAVRRETLKAGLVYALVDAAVVAVAVTLLVASLDVGWLPEVVRFDVPAPVSTLLSAVFGTPGGQFVFSGAAIVGVAVAAVNVVAELLYLRRQDPMAWFEAANPVTGAALRTARDTAEAGSEDVMARRLYADVRSRLAESSGSELLDRRRLAVPLALLVVVSLGATQVAVVGFTVDVPTIGGDGAPPPDPSDGAPPDPTDGGGGLGPPREVLGEPTDPPRGETPDDVVVDPGGSSGEDDRPVETGGFPSGSVDVDAAVSGYAPPADLGDADLVQSYLVAIRNGSESSG